MGKDAAGPISFFTPHSVLNPSLQKPRSTFLVKREGNVTQRIAQATQNRNHNQSNNVPPGLLDNLSPPTWWNHLRVVELAAVNLLADAGEAALAKLTNCEWSGRITVARGI